MSTGLVDKELLKANSICNNHISAFESWKEQPDKIHPTPTFPVMTSTKYQLLSGLKIDEDFLPWIAPIYLKHILAAEVEVLAMIREIGQLTTDRINKSLEKALTPDDAAPENSDSITGNERG